MPEAPAVQTPASSPPLRRTKRRHRYPLGGTFWCRPAGDLPDYWWLVYSVNLTTSGIVLCLSRPVTPGSLLALESVSQTGQRGPSLRALVVFARKRPAGGWQIGCTFVKPLRGSVA